MLPVEIDTYNRLVTKQELESSYKIFKELLKPQCINKNLREQILSQNLELNALNRVITLDCHRTRSTNFNESIKKDLQYFLSYFVRKHSIQYKQGLNEIAAPFIYWTKIGVDIGQCYEMFEKFFLKFSLNFYYDKNFTGLEMFFRMISIVLRYHCPSLSRYLEVYDIEPQLYALSWLMTLFSSKLSLQMTYLMWSYLIAENDRYLLFFIVVGIIVRRQNQIIQTQNNSIFRIVTDMIFKGQEELQEVIKISLILRNSTPFSLTTFFEEKQLFDRMDSYKQSAQLLQHINKLNLFLILPKQLYYTQSHYTQNCSKPSCVMCLHNKIISFDRQIFVDTHLKNLIEVSNDVKKIKKNIEYVIIDLRKQQTKLKSFENVHSVDITQPFQQIETEFLNNFMELKYSKHFIILLTGFTFQDVTFSDLEEFRCAKKLLQVLNSYSIAYLGILQGGFTALSIFQQEFRIKKEFQNSISLNQQMKIEERQQKQQQEKKENFNHLLQRQFSLSVSMLFQIAELKSNNRLKFYHGQQKTLTILTELFLIVIEDIKGLNTFTSFIEHNCSIMPYFLSNSTNIQCKFLKILPVSKITSLKTKKGKQNVLIIKYKLDQDITRAYQNTIKIDSKQKSNESDSSSSILQEFRSLLFKKYSNLTTNQKKVQQNVIAEVNEKKISLIMKNQDVVNQISEGIKKTLKNQLKRKLQKIKKSP